MISVQRNIRLLSFFFSRLIMMLSAMTDLSCQTWGLFNNRKHCQMDEWLCPWTCRLWTGSHKVTAMPNRLYCGESSSTAKKMVEFKPRRPSTSLSELIVKSHGTVEKIDNFSDIMMRFGCVKCSLSMRNIICRFGYKRVQWSDEDHGTYGYPMD
ncbi:hypothetical protein C8R41DRAFT_807738 [Lentinula lateritia]|uniref:Secreted protein n=1 Tax=Lentinula lateritia TaxID=40482 RepID=A0ABQ8VXF9_9AGAR|nr:hypothetical protein C8R41DRAFT_807738 [Lentinula lateritia]